NRLLGMCKRPDPLRRPYDAGEGPAGGCPSPTGSGSLGFFCPVFLSHRDEGPVAGRSPGRPPGSGRDGSGAGAGPGRPRPRASLRLDPRPPKGGRDGGAGTTGRCAGRKPLEEDVSLLLPLQLRPRRPEPARRTRDLVRSFLEARSV